MRTRFDIYPATASVVYRSGEEPSYEYFRLPASDHLFAKWGTGSVYTQASRCDPHYDYFHVSIEIFEETAIEMKVAELVHVVEYTIAGNMYFKTGGGEILALLKNTYRVMRLSAGVYTAILKPGRYSFLYLIPSAAQLEGLCSEHPAETSVDEKKESDNCRSKRMMITAPVWQELDRINGTQKKGFGLGLDLAGCMMKLLSLLDSDLTKAGNNLAILEPADFVDQVENFIMQNLADRRNTTVKTLAVMFNMSESSFKRKFKINFTKPVHEYILGRRLETAKALIRGGNITLDKVAIRVGYSDAFTLSRQLKKHAT